LIEARRHYPLDAAYQEQDRQWNLWLDAMEDKEAAELIRERFAESREWEARFLMMSDKYIAQTDYLGLCNDRLKSIREWNTKAKQTGLPGGLP